MKENKPKKPLSEFIFDELRGEILSGNLKPGERLMEIKYAQSLGVSRTPFREAVRKLEKEGLVTVLPRRGAHVSLLSVKDLCDVLDIRCALDMLAIEKFIENAKDADMHNLKLFIDTFAKATESDNLQEQAAANLGLNTAIIVAANTVGGGIGNMICVNNVVAACATAGTTGKEGKIIRVNAILTAIYTVIVILVLMAAFYILGL